MHAVRRVCNMRRQSSCMSDLLLFLIAFKRRLPYVEGPPRKKKEKFAAGKIIYHMWELKIIQSWPARSRVASSSNSNFCTSKRQPEILVFRYFHNLSLSCRWFAWVNLLYSFFGELLVQLCCDAWLLFILSLFLCFLCFVVVIVAPDYRIRFVVV
jgi:hypothetical protein